MGGFWFRSRAICVVRYNIFQRERVQQTLGGSESKLSVPPFGDHYECNEYVGPNSDIEICGLQLLSVPRLLTS